MQSVFVAHLFSSEGSTFFGVFSTPDKAIAVLRDHASETLNFREYTIKTSGLKFWTAHDPETTTDEEYSVKEELVQ